MGKPRREKSIQTSSAFKQDTLNDLQLNIGDQRNPLLKTLKDALCSDGNRIDKPEIGVAQISALRNAGNQLLTFLKENENQQNVEIDYILSVLSFLFVKCKAKHPARRAIASIFQAIAVSYNDAVVSCLHHSLLNELQDATFLAPFDEPSGERPGPVLKEQIETVMAYMENFATGKEVVGKCSERVLDFLLEGLTKEMKDASSTISLDEQTSSMTNSLSALKAIVAVLHCKESFDIHHGTDTTAKHSIKREIDVGEVEGRTLDMNSTSIYVNDKQLCFTGDGKNVLYNLLNKCILILSDVNYILDCRNTAGVALISILRALVQKSILHNVIDAHLLVHFKECSRQEKGEEKLLKGDVKSECFSNDGTFVKFNQIERKVVDFFKKSFHDIQDSTTSCLLICHGIITKLDSDVLHGEYHVETSDQSSAPVLDKTNNCDQEKRQAQVKSLFTSSVLSCLLRICSAVNEKGIVVYAFKTLFCWTQEALGHCRRLEKQFGSFQAGNFLQIFHPCSETTISLIETLNNYLDHPIDAVRHQVRNSLENIIKIVKLFQDSAYHIKEILKTWLSGKLNIRSKCLALSCILNYIEIDVFLEIRRSFPQDLLNCLDDSNLISYICDLYVKAASKHKSEITDFESNVPVWVSVWCEPVFRSLSAIDRLQRNAIIDYIVPGLLICYPDLIRLILSRSLNPDSAKDYMITSVVFLARARITKECAHVRFTVDRDSSSELWHGLISMHSIKYCLSHIDEQVRLEAIGLICESKKTTEPIDDQDLKLLRFFIPLNMTSQSPQFRNQFIFSLKKAFGRMMERSKQLAKEISDLKSLRERLKDATHTSQNKILIEAGERELQRYAAFTTWIFEFMVGCLHPGACFPRINTALEIVCNAVKALKLQDGKHVCPIKCCWKTVFNKLVIRTFIDCLHDTYDINRFLSNEILGLLPRDFYTFTSADILRLFNQVLILAQSAQPDNTNTAPCLLKFLANQSINERTKEALLAEFPEYSSNIKNDKCIYILHLIIVDVLLNKVDEQLRIAKENLLSAALSSPLHGTLQCIREMLSAVRFTEAENRSSWKILINRLINCCFEIANLVGPIVSSSAPEGHIIEDVGDHNVIASQIINELDGESCDHSKGVEEQAYLSQMLLACCWRSMKETVLLLGDIASCVPVFEVNNQSETIISSSTQRYPEKYEIPSIDVNTDNAPRLISSCTVIDIGNLFIHILLSSRHIGAFELAYPGFVKVCSVLWKSDLTSLNVLPSKWIDELLVNLQAGDATQNFCVTRRSAGLPFYISAICSTEPGVNRRTTLRKVMQVLIEICQKSQEIDKGTENEGNTHNGNTKVICLNILRALYRDTKFGEDVFPYVSDGFIIAVNGFSSCHWAIRNACTLLFSALMTRVFGVKKTPMSGAEFFARFPTVYPFLIEEMKKITVEEENSRSRIYLHPSVFPVLFLLSHLYPSSLDGNNSKINMASFIPYIIRCGDSSVYKIRAMSARALASVVTSSNLLQILNHLIASQPTSDSRDFAKHNSVHGCLLQIKALLSGKLSNEKFSSSLRKDIMVGPVLGLRRLLWLLSSNNPCSLNKALLLEIINDNIFKITDQDEGCLNENQQKEFTQIKNDCLDCCLEELDVTIPRNDNGGPQENLKKVVGHELVRKQAIIAIQGLLSKKLELLDNVAASKSMKPLFLVRKLITSEFHDVHLSLLDWLTTKGSPVLEDENVTKLLQERMLSDEGCSDCLAGICDVLAKRPKIQFPWQLNEGKEKSAEEVWRHLRLQMNVCGKRQNFHAAALRFCLVLVSHFNQLIQSSEDPETNKAQTLECLREILAFVQASCEPEVNLMLREVVAEVIGNEVFLRVASLAVNIQLYSAEIIFIYWRCVLKLLQDEELTVRSIIAKKIFVFLNENQYFEDKQFLPGMPTVDYVQPSLVLRLTVETIAKLYYRVYPAECFEFLVSLIIGKTASGMSCLLSDKQKLQLEQLAHFTDGNTQSKVLAVDEKLLCSIQDKSDVHCEMKSHNRSDINTEDIPNTCSKLPKADPTKDPDLPDVIYDTDKHLPLLENVAVGSQRKAFSRNSSPKYAVIFEKTDTANSYLEELTIGHIAFEELQNQIALQRPSLSGYTKLFISYLWSHLRSWIHDLDNFFSKENFKNTCQVLMGLYIALCVNRDDMMTSLLDGFRIFCEHFDDACPNEPPFDNVALYNHLTNVRALCGL